MTKFLNTEGVRIIWTKIKEFVNNKFSILDSINEDFIRIVDFNTKWYDIIIDENDILNSTVILYPFNTNAITNEELEEFHKKVNDVFNFDKHSRVIYRERDYTYKLICEYIISKTSILFNSFIYDITNKQRNNSYINKNNNIILEFSYGEVS